MVPESALMEGLVSGLGVVLAGIAFLCASE